MHKDIKPVVKFKEERVDNSKLKFRKIDKNNEISRLKRHKRM